MFRKITKNSGFRDLDFTKDGKISRLRSLKEVKTLVGVIRGLFREKLNSFYLRIKTVDEDFLGLNDK